MEQTRKCACHSLDARACYDSRYPLTLDDCFRYEELSERDQDRENYSCECFCHDPDPDEFDEDDGA